MDQAVFDKIKAIIVDKVDGVDPAQVTPGASLTGDLGADSLDVFEVIYAIESDMGVSITADDVKNELKKELKDVTVGEVAGLVAKFSSNPK